MFSEGGKRLTNLWPSDSGSNWNLEMLVFEEWGNLLGARTKSNNKFNPYIAPSPGIELGPYWWESLAMWQQHETGTGTFISVFDDFANFSLSFWKKSSVAPTLYNVFCSPKVRPSESKDRPKVASHKGC